jgi:hypothetical protein
VVGRHGRRGSFQRDHCIIDGDFDFIFVEASLSERGTTIPYIATYRTKITGLYMKVIPGPGKDRFGTTKVYVSEPRLGFVEASHGRCVSKW